MGMNLAPSLPLKTALWAFQTRVARFLFVEHTKMEKNIPNDHKMRQIQMPQNKPNSRKMDQMTIKYIYQHPLEDLPKVTKFAIFCLKIYHLATLLQTRGRKLQPGCPDWANFPPTGRLFSLDSSIENS
jgi:hypothetical protein